MKPRCNAALCACLALCGGLATADTGAWQLGVDTLRVEAASGSGSADESGRLALAARPYVAWQPGEGWEFRAQVRLSALSEGTEGGRYRTDGAEPVAFYVRSRFDDSRVTLGYQTVVWSRADEVSAIDRVSRFDFSGLVSDTYAERRLAQPGLRWEQSLGDYQLDAIALWPQQGAVLPDARSPWFPVNRGSGEVLGIQSTPPLAAFVRQASLRVRDPDDAGAALRLTHDDGLGLSWGLTLARMPAALPHFEVDTMAGTLTQTHPSVRFAGVDAELASDDATWRAEVGWSPDTPYTATDGSTVRLGTLQWVAGVEFFPGGEETRVSLQLAGRWISGGPPILQWRDQTALNGEVSTNFARGTWKASVRFNLGLHQRDSYLAPRLSYTGMEPHEFYVGALLFSGEGGTAGGYYRNQDLLTFGVVTRF